ncbi:uncharacterized protein LOC141594294 [Silene latifolia]|uniref:uncharacterized protein LOC141594294 n=1 Tax=Silene latifolia TaxID=37657 RepID=UPI003D776895
MLMDMCAANFREMFVSEIIMMLRCRAILSFRNWQSSVHLMCLQFDRKCSRVREHELSAVTEVEYGNAQIVPDGLDSRPPVLTSFQISRSADICAQDADTRQDSTSIMSIDEMKVVKYVSAIKCFENMEY